MTSGSNSPRQIQPTVSAAQLVDVYQALLDLGASPQAIRQESGLGPDHLQGVDSRLPGGNALKLWQYLIRQSGNPWCGFEIGQVVRTESMGVIGNLVLTSATLGEALKRLLRFYGLLTEVEQARLSEVDANTLIYSFHCLQPDMWCSAMLHRSLAAGVAWSTAFAGRELPIKAIYLKRPAEGAAEVSRYFKCPVLFGRPLDGIVFERALLDVPGVHHNSYMTSILEARARSLHGSLDSVTSLEEKIRNQLTMLLPDGEGDIETVADALGLSRSFVYRQLKKSGLTFSQILDGQRRKLSRFYLQSEGLTKTEVALLLGYSELSAYLRAERRWNMEPKSDI